MSTNRPFLYNFFAAFRAHSAVQKAATTSSPTTTGSSSQSSYIHTASITTSPHSTSNHHASSNPRSIAAKSSPHAAGPTTSAVQSASQFQATRQHASSPYSRSSSSPGSPGFPISSGPNRGRRGSDSSSEGFRETLGAEKWFIGGRTAAGDEKFYRLGMVKRPRSVDRLSLDRLSI